MVKDLMLTVLFAGARHYQNLLEISGANFVPFLFAYFLNFSQFSRIFPKFSPNFCLFNPNFLYDMWWAIITCVFPSENKKTEFHLFSNQLKNEKKKKKERNQGLNLKSKGNEEWKP